MIIIIKIKLARFKITGSKDDSAKFLSHCRRLRIYAQAKIVTQV